MVEAMMLDIFIGFAIISRILRPIFVVQISELFVHPCAPPQYLQLNLQGRTFKNNNGRKEEMAVCW